MIITPFSNEIGDSGIASISSALKVNSSLTSLDLRRRMFDNLYVLSFIGIPINKISEVGVSSLSEALKVNSTLLELNLAEWKLFHSMLSLFFIQKNAGLEKKEHPFCLWHWRLIQLSLLWIWIF